MENGKGFLGRLFGNDMILWFIILFLLLFWCTNCFRADNRENDVDLGLAHE
ncbi:MAG TPA: hypothetical protein PK733_03505 [Clostridiales bacterium]|nr:hypothetical protein [Clostridiales bacterium]